LSDVDGTLYGTTSPGDGGYGTVYSVTTSGAHKVLYRFVGAPDGASPVGGLTDMNGTLYGTTSGGGDTSCKGLIKGSPGCGTIYSITTGGTENVLYSFTGGLDGNTPLAPLIAVKGSLYGTTGYDGNDAPRKTQDNCCGTVFRFTP
jgi:uncharacterized repeat protein (TIGR03803 family)